MAGDSIIDRLAHTAAEKRAYWGGYGNPYMGYGGYGGGFSMYPGMGGYGRYPMMGMRGPYGGYYGMDPRFVGLAQYGMMQGLGQQAEAFRRGLPGIDINLQGQQAGVLGQMQQQPGIQQQQRMAETGVGQAYGDQDLGEREIGSMQSDLDKQRAFEAAKVKELDPINKQIADITKRYGEERAGHEAAIQALSSAASGGGSLDWARLQAQKGDPTAIALLQRLGHKATGEVNPLSAAWARARGMFGGQGTFPEYEAAAKAHGLLSSLEQRRAAELSKPESQWSTIEGVRRGYADTATQREKEIAARTESMRRARERAGEESFNRRTQSFDPANTMMQNVGQISMQHLTRPPRPGAQPRLQTPTQPGVQPRPPLPTPTTTAVPNRPAPKPVFTPAATAPPPSTGGMGPGKRVSLVELADKSARVHLEHRREKAAGLGDLLGGRSMQLPGATTRTGVGKSIPSAADILDKVRNYGRGLPSVAQKVQPKLDTDAIMKSVGLQGMPSSLAHLPLETAVGMGVTPDQHAALRKAMGL